MKRFIFFGCAAQSELDSLRRRDEVGEKLVSDLNESGKSFVVGIIVKIKSRLLVGSSFLRQAACLDPSQLSILGKELVLLRFTQLVQQLSHLKIIACELGDKSLNEFDELINKEENISMFKKFDSSSQRLDSFFFNNLNVQKYESLSIVIKCVLLLFHSQSEVERGFSSNKNLLNDNMEEKTLVARCCIKDHMQT